MRILKPFFLVLFLVTQIEALFSKTQQESVVLAGGCFWCMEPPYDELKGEGILKTTVGYAGGKLENPSYEKVASGQTKHLEAIEVVYNPERISLEKVYTLFWKNIDPFDDKGQFCDKGRHYRAAVFLKDEKQKKSYETVKKKVLSELDGKKKLAVLELSTSTFYPAEDYHQDYYQKNPIRYKFYRYRCGRDERLKEVWGH